MTHPEHTSGWEPASSRELSDLYYKTMQLVKKVGVYTLEPGADIPKYEGLPITEDPPRYDLSLSVDEVWQFSPRAADILQVGGPLELMYSEQCYVPVGDGVLKYQVPYCGFLIYHAPDSPYSHRYIDITLSGTGESESGGRRELRGPLRKSQSHIPLDELLLSLATKIKMERQTGINETTKNECMALDEIVEAKSRIS